MISKYKEQKKLQAVFSQSDFESFCRKVTSKIGAAMVRHTFNRSTDFPKAKSLFPLPSVWQKPSQ